MDLSKVHNLCPKSKMDPTMYYLFPNIDDIEQNLTRILRIDRSRKRQRELSGTVHTRFAFAEFGSIERMAAKIPHLFAAIAFHRCVLPVSCIDNRVSKIIYQSACSFRSRLTDLVRMEKFSKLRDYGEKTRSR